MEEESTKQGILETEGLRPTTGHNGCLMMMMMMMKITGCGFAMATAYSIVTFIRVIYSITII